MVISSSSSVAPVVVDGALRAVRGGRSEAEPGRSEPSAHMRALPGGPARWGLGVTPWGVVAGHRPAPTFTRSGIAAGQGLAPRLALVDRAPREPPSAVL